MNMILFGNIITSLPRLFEQSFGAGLLLVIILLILTGFSLLLGFMILVSLWRFLNQTILSSPVEFYGYAMHKTSTDAWTEVRTESFHGGAWTSTFKTEHPACWLIEVVTDGTVLPQASREKIPVDKITFDQVQPQQPVKVTAQKSLIGDTLVNPRLTLLQTLPPQLHSLSFAQLAKNSG